MDWVHEYYELLILNKNYDSVKEFEKSNNFPRKWLDSVINKLMQKRDFDSEDLKQGFSDRD